MLPSVQAALGSPGGQRLQAVVPPEVALESARRALAALRGSLLTAEVEPTRGTLLTQLSEGLAAEALGWSEPALLPVLNATGIVLHTNLGRAPLGERVCEALAVQSRGYAAVELDLASGRRGHRDRVVEPALCALTGAEAAVVVNNCAAAVLLALSALAAGREVLVSRGELVEIGGGFRVPEIIQSCGATLVEVGTTNRTRAEDYVNALGARTAALLKVHRSNFSMQGFCASPERSRLAAIASSHGIPLLEDLGSGLLEPLAGVSKGEATVREALEGGASLVFFSGDKLLGGPQAGLLVGRSELVGRLRKHPLARALRPGRLVLSALEHTLSAYLRGRAAQELPVLRMLSSKPAELRARAELLELRLGELLAEQGRRVPVQLVEVEGKVGGGAIPEARLPSWALAISEEVRSTESLLADLRRGRPQALLGRAEGGRALFDVRTLDGAGALEAAAHALARALSAAHKEQRMAELGGASARERRDTEDESPDGD